MASEKLINKVIEQIKKDISVGDVTAIEELLQFTPKENLIAYLPEEEWPQFQNEYMCENCGGGFSKDEMEFDVNDVDLCKDCCGSSKETID